MRGDGQNQLQILGSPLNIYNLFEKEKYDISTMEKIAVAE
jgi:hypothetical protein